jgi:prepilin-type processing-associated H-X9-DG protein
MSSASPDFPSRGSRWDYTLFAAIAFIVAVFVLLILPSIDVGVGIRTPARRNNCSSNLKQFGIALYNYHDTFNQFPPAYIADDNGRPMHSWRILLLPFFEEEGLKDLAKQYDFNEPWDGPNNSKLADKMPAVFRCPSDESKRNEADYVAVVDPETAWPGTSGLSARQIHDGTSNTIMLVEVANSGINWLEPRDLTLGQAMRGFNVAGIRPAISSKHSGGANILFADGSVHFLTNEITPELLRALLTANGGEVAEPPTD